MKKIYTLYICIILISQITYGQNTSKDSVTFNLFVPVGFYQYIQPEDVNIYFKTINRDFDSTEIIDLIVEMNGLIEVVKSGNGIVSSNTMLDSLNKFELIFVQKYGIEQYDYGLSEKGSKYSEIKKYEYEKDKMWKNEISIHNTLTDCTIWKSENILLINFEQLWVGQYRTAHWGQTFYLVRNKEN